MSCMRFALGLILASLFICVFPLVIWSVTLEWVLLSRATYTEALDDAIWYEGMISHMLPAMMEEEELAQHRIPNTDLTVAEVFGNLTLEDWRAISALLIPEDWLYNQLAHNINALFDWFESDEAIPDLRVDMSSIRMNALGAPGREIANMVILSWDRCTEAEETQLEAFLAGEAAPVLCQPPGSMVARTSEVIAEPAMAAIASQIIGDFTYYELAHSLPDLEKDQIRYAWNAFKYNLNLAKRLSWMWYLIPVALLALIVIVAVRHARAFFAWMGGILLVGGFVSLLLPLLLLLVGLGMIRDLFALETGPGLVDRQAGFLLYGGFEGVLNTLMGSYAQPMLFQSAFAILAGFISLFLAVAVFKTPASVAVETAAIQSAFEARVESEVQARLRNGDASEFQTPKLPRRSPEDEAESNDDQEGVE